MKKFISFGKIRQFRDFVTGSKQRFQFVGLDENGKSIYDHNKLLPKVSVSLTEKIHGTNAAVCYNNVGGFGYSLVLLSLLHKMITSLVLFIMKLSKMRG